MSHERNQPLAMPATITECELLMEQLSADCNRVRDQIEASKARQKQTGKYADAQWFQRASSALRWLSRDRQRLQNHMAQLRRGESQAVAQRRDRLLIAALREQVSPEVFQACVDLARQQDGGGV